MNRFAGGGFVSLFTRVMFVVEPVPKRSLGVDIRIFARYLLLQPNQFHGKWPCLWSSLIQQGLDTMVRVREATKTTRPVSEVWEDLELGKMYIDLLFHPWVEFFHPSCRFLGLLYEMVAWLLYEFMVGWTCTCCFTFFWFGFLDTAGIIRASQPSYLRWVVEDEMLIIRLFKRHLDFQVQSSTLGVWKEGVVSNQNTLVLVG